MSDTDSNKGCGSPESVVDYATADQQNTEIEQLKKQLEAANLQIRHKDNWLAAADADHHNLREQVEAALQDTDRQLAEAAQATNNARHVLQELNLRPNNSSSTCSKRERHGPLSAGKSTYQAAMRSSTYICFQSCARSATSGHRSDCSTGSG